MAWDKDRYPTRGILKKRKQPNLAQTAINSLLVNETTATQETLKEDIPDIVNLMNQLSILAKSQPVNTTAGKLYQKFEDCDYYNVSTPLTLQHQLSRVRIQQLGSHTTFISPNDICSLPTLLDELIKDGQFSLSNEFYVDAYWTISLLDIICYLVFETFKMDNTTEVSYDPSKVFEKGNPLDFIEHTHILKDQISVCEWLSTTIGPNYAKEDVPPQLRMMLLRELDKLKQILYAYDEQWLEQTMMVLC